MFQREAIVNFYEIDSANKQLQAILRIPIWRTIILKYTKCLKESVNKRNNSTKFFEAKGYPPHRDPNKYISYKITHLTHKKKDTPTFFRHISAFLKSTSILFKYPPR